jgi:hypothetical protein
VSLVVVGNWLPGGERAGFLSVGLSLLGVVQILADSAGAAFAKTPEELFERIEQIVFHAKVAEVPVATAIGIQHVPFHFLAVEPVKAVALHDCRLHALAPEDVGEGACDRGGAGP